MKDEKSIINEKIEYLDKLIEECEALRIEWQQRLNEAKQARDNYNNLIKETMLAKKD